MAVFKTRSQATQLIKIRNCKGEPQKGAGKEINEKNVRSKRAHQNELEPLDEGVGEGAKDSKKEDIRDVHQEQHNGLHGAVVHQSCKQNVEKNRKHGGKAYVVSMIKDKYVNLKYDTKYSTGIVQGRNKFGEEMVHNYCMPHTRQRDNQASSRTPSTPKP